MSKWQYVLLAVVLVAPLGGFHSWVKSFPGPEQVNRMVEQFNQTSEWKGRVSPNFEIDTLNGRTISLEEHVGKRVIVINFFATWCKPCREEIPLLNKFHNKHRKNPVMLIGVDVGETREKVENFVRSQGIKYPVALDQDSLSSKFDVSSFPTTVVIDAKGRVRLYEVGQISNLDVTFSDLLKKQFEQLRNGEGISREKYKKLLESESYQQGGDSELSGHALRLARTMGCKCGCEQELLQCDCQTATGMKQRLSELNGNDLSDTKTIKKVNKEFCVGDSG
ncbi:MAG: TlpA family protein disulfide reductase [bacterium]